MDVPPEGGGGWGGGGGEVYNQLSKVFKIRTYILYSHSFTNKERYLSN